MGFRQPAGIQLQRQWSLKKRYHNEQDTALTLFLPHFLVWATRTWYIGLSPKLPLGSRVQRTTKKTIPGTPGLKKARQGEHAPTWLHHCGVGQPRYLRPQSQPKATIRVRIRVQRTTKPTTTGTLRLEKACQGEHSTNTDISYMFLNSVIHGT